MFIKVTTPYNAIMYYNTDFIKSFSEMEDGTAFIEFNDTHNIQLDKGEWEQIKNQLLEKRYGNFYGADTMLLSTTSNTATKQYALESNGQPLKIPREKLCKMLIGPNEDKEQ